MKLFPLLKLFELLKLLVLVSLFTLFFITGCAPSKAFVDRSMMGSIVWPGPPEQPRIKFMWVLSQLSTEVEGRRGLLDFVAGDVREDVTDPKTSNVLIRPYGVFADSKEKLYVADPGAARVSIIDLKTAEVLNVLGAEKTDLSSPVGVVADPEGRVFVSDSELKKVVVFNDKGKFLYAFEGDFKRPSCLAIDTKTSRVYVSDTLEHKIFVYSAEGKRIGSIGHFGSGPGEFNFPTHLFVDSNSLLYVTDTMNFRVQIFDGNGTLLRTFGTLGDAEGNLEKPKGLAVDTEGHIYVVDSIKDTVKIFDREGNLLLFFGDRGSNYGDFWLPSGIFIDNKNTIYVADTYNMRIQAFQFIGGGERK
jgi:DNA-binding beta-propeller fold protein YncE